MNLLKKSKTEDLEDDAEIAELKSQENLNDVRTLINLSQSEDKILNGIESSDDVIILNSHKGPIIAKTPGQKKYFKSILLCLNFRFCLKSLRLIYLIKVLFFNSFIKS